MRKKNSVKISNIYIKHGVEYFIYREKSNTDTDNKHVQDHVRMLHIITILLKTAITDYTCMKHNVLYR